MVNYLYIISKANEAHVITIWAAKNNILISILPGDPRKSIFSYFETEYLDKFNVTFKYSLGSESESYDA
jgi:hypothetical protein